jgi:hypothetical protein
MSYRSLGSDEVTLRNYRPVGRRKGNMSLSDPLAAGVSLTFINPASSVVFGNILIYSATYSAATTGSSSAGTEWTTFLPCIHACRRAR